MTQSNEISENRDSEEWRHAETVRLNDLARTLMGIGGRMVVTRTLHDTLSPADMFALTTAIKEFDAWDDGDDPYGLHDFGALFGVETDKGLVWATEINDSDEEPFNGIRVFWKIDVYDPTMEYGSEKPWLASESKRVLTIMLADDY